MSDFDDRARASGERIRHEADHIAASAEPLGRLQQSGGGRARGRVLMVAAAALVVLGGVAGLFLTSDRSTTDVRTSTPPDSPPTSSATSTPAAPTATFEGTRTNPATTATAAPTATTEPLQASITRPIVDPAICEPISASGGAPSGLPRDPNASLPLTLFARPSSFAVPIQIIGDPVDGQAKPFALLQRYVDRDRQLTSPDHVESINGIDVFVREYPNGNGEAEWTLPDGSIGYLRARGLDREQLVSILTQLTPRPADAPIPGFDYGPDGPDGLELVAEALNTDPRESEGAGSQCRVASTGYVYRINTLSGSEVLTYAIVIDRPPPVDVGVVGDQVIVIGGPEDPAAPTASDVIDANEEAWRELLIADDSDELAQLIGGDTEVVVDFVPIDDTSTPVGSLTLRVSVTDGQASLEVYSANAVVAGEAEYWKTEIDGRIRSRSTATPGPGRDGAFGSSLGPAPVGEELGREFTVRISTTDGDDQTIQTTGEIRLVLSDQT